MTYQPFNWAAIPVREPKLDFVGSLAEGFKAGQLPSQYKRMAEQEELANAFQKMKMEQNQNSPFGGQQITGDVAQALYLEMMRQRFGEDSIQYKNAQRAFDASIKSKESLSGQRDVYAQTAPKRFSTSLGKTEQEIADIESGFMPGTDRKENLSPEQQKSMLDRYELKRQKDISDTQARQRALFASNVDKTLEEIDPKDLTQYGGLKGQAAFSGDKIASAFGKEPERYVKYQKALTLANLLAKQVRQFYGDSITPQIQEKLSELTNPATWSNNPTVALEKFNTFKNILQKETSTYRGALKSTEEFQEKKSTGDTDYVRDPKTGKLRKK